MDSNPGILNALLEDLRQAFNSENEGLQLREGLKGNNKINVTIRKRETYQFAYFFRKSQPHSVLFKTRTFTEEKAPEGKGKTPVQINDDPDDDGDDDEEGEEQKPKLKMQLSFKGLTVTEKCLCIIIEPRTSDMTTDLRQSTLEEVMRRTQFRSTSVVQQQQQKHDKTPLFLPDLDFDRETPATFATSSVVQRSFSDGQFLSPGREDNESDDDLHAFGETLNSIQDGMVGDMDDDDADEGEAFLGDADERKGAL